MISSEQSHVLDLPAAGCYSIPCKTLESVDWSSFADLADRWQRIEVGFSAFGEWTLKND